MTKIPTESFLNSAYSILGYTNGVGLHDPETNPSKIEREGIEGKFSSLKLAEKLNADRVFFFKDFPAVLFFECESMDEDYLRNLHIRVWNTSKTPLYFVGSTTELRLYDAYQEPVSNLSDWEREQRWLVRVNKITEISEQLKEYSRINIESQKAFANVNFKKRADQFLLKNLEYLREQLVEKGLELKHTLSLLRRSIFIRYLEDRKVLLKQYFESATNNKSASTFIQILQNKNYTYNLFEKLKSKFNGDIFSYSEEEREAVTSEHVEILGHFLSGNSLGLQNSLFFWAYQFDVIPIELISSIYEQFYHAGKSNDHSATHYTPASLVDFIFSNPNIRQNLSTGKVLDLSCGSGIFLVEAFRQIVYGQIKFKKRNLKPVELQKLLRERIFGIDINGEAVRVAAFSLYLALLDFMEPADIRKHTLPLLLHDNNKIAGEANGSNLFESNAFFLTPLEQKAIETRLQSSASYSGRAIDEQINKFPILPLTEHSFEVIVGNPPWGAPAKNNAEGMCALLWQQANQLPVGDKELSQCFTWRVYSLLATNGVAGLLISYGGFHNRSQHSYEFRQTLLKKSQIRAVYDFSHVRSVFFNQQLKKAISPFVAIFFSKPDSQDVVSNNKLLYGAIKRNFLVQGTQTVSYDKTDIHYIKQASLLNNDLLWKILLWGNIADAALISEIQLNSPLSNYVYKHGRGYQEGGGDKKHSTKELGVIHELEEKSFGLQLDLSNLKKIVERRIHSIGQIDVYRGPRILIKRGIQFKTQGLNPIVATYAEGDFAFRNSIHGLRVDNISNENRKVILGILISSLGSYYHFMTASKWGFWHDDIQLGEHLKLPIKIPQTFDLSRQISVLVDELTATPSSFTIDSPSNSREKQERLNRAIYDLYELDQSERDLIEDFTKTTLDFINKGNNSNAFKAPLRADLQKYAATFLDSWNFRLEPKGLKLSPCIYAPLNASMMRGISFDLVSLEYSKKGFFTKDNKEWENVFNRLSSAIHVESSQQIYVNKEVKAIDNNSIIIIKHAKKYLWTASQARKDAHELLTDLFKAEWQRDSNK